MKVIHELADGREVDSIDGYTIPAFFETVYKIAERKIKNDRDQDHGEYVQRTV